MVIGIIDTGTDKDHRRFTDTPINGITLFKDKEGKINTVLGDFKDFKGHGTGIASIIIKHAPDAEVFVVKISSYDGKISEDLMEQAIAYLINNTTAKVINISMGINTNSPSKRLKMLCDLAEQKNVIISAAAYYKYDELCFPAAFGSVFGIGTGIVKNKNEFRFLKNKSADVLCKGGFQRVAVPGNQFSFSTGTSLASAHFTGIIAKARMNGDWSDKASLISWLHEHSDDKIASFTKHDQASNLNGNFLGEKTDTLAHFEADIALPKNIRKIALFPFEEKEMKSLMELKAHSPFTITLAIGYPRSLKLDDAMDTLLTAMIKHTTQLPSEEEYDYFDTVVIGYFLDKLSDHNSYFGYHLIKACIARNKNFIVWDKTVNDLITQTIKENNYDYKGEIHFTSFDAKKMHALFSAMDYSELRKPSLCVIGTNSRQGKFTTQLTIKKILEQHQYKVSHLTTEPQGVLLGSKITFPIGHNGTVYVDVRNWNKILQLIIQYLENTENPDIIITRSQGGILPLHPINDALPPEKLIYVKSFYPDALICTISPNDSIEFIKKTVETVKSYVKTKVLFYVMTPWKYKFYHGQKSIVSFEKADNYEDRRLYYERELNAKVINIKDKKYHKIILETITNFFAKDE